MTIASDFATTPSPSLHLLSRDHCGRNHQDQNRGNEAYSMVQYQRQNVENSVQKSSIQNQFTVLSNQRDKFVRDREEAERELKQVQTEHQYIKKELETLTESNRRSKEGLGQRMEKLVLLKKEESRLRQIIENEFQSIQSCTTHSKMVSIACAILLFRYNVKKTLQSHSLRPLFASSSRMKKYFSSQIIFGRCIGNATPNRWKRRQTKPPGNIRPKWTLSTSN